MITPAKPSIKPSGGTPIDSKTRVICARASSSAFALACFLSCARRLRTQHVTAQLSPIARMELRITTARSTAASMNARGNGGLTGTGGGTGGTGGAGEGRGGNDGAGDGGGSLGGRGGLGLGGGGGCNGGNGGACGGGWCGGIGGGGSGGGGDGAEKDCTISSGELRDTTFTPMTPSSRSGS